MEPGTPSHSSSLPSDSHSLLSWRRWFLPQGKLNSLKFEISILYTVVLGVILIIFSSVQFFLLPRTFYVELDSDLKFKAQQISQSIRSYLDVRGMQKDNLRSAVERTIAEDSKNQNLLLKFGFERRWLARLAKLDFSEEYINFVSPDGKPLMRSKNMSEGMVRSFMRGLKIPEGLTPSYRNIVYKKDLIRVLNYPLVLNDGQKYLLQVGSPETEAIQLLQNWLISMAVSIPVILFLTSWMGRLLSARILDPVHEITTAARNITYHDLSRRVQTQRYDKEMHYLVEAFNNMISRLEKSFSHIEEFSSHVAHELKTPLAIIKGEAELAMRKDRTCEEYKRILHLTLEESERMVRTIEDLLLLAKLDYQPEVFHFEVFNFSVFFREICEQTRLLAASKNIQMAVDMPRQDILIRGDKLHLRRLFFNLIDNAIKFTPGGGNVKLSVQTQSQRLIVCVSDSGAGIPREELEKIFLRKYRANNTAPGTGLGLYMARSIAVVHQGDIFVESVVNSGTTFKVILPIT